MALVDFQTSLAHLVRAANGADRPVVGSLSVDERAYLGGLTENPAFRFTVRVQRSWCVGRAAKAAYLTLSILPCSHRELLLQEWVDSGGGTHSFVGAESASFLEFIANRLADPSHELTICRMELAALRSSEGSLRFTSPAPSRLDSPGCLLQRGRFAGVVRFYAEPQQVLSAFAKREPRPPISTDATSLLFGPGFDRLYTKAVARELALYERLQSLAPATQLIREGFDRETILRLLDAGVLEYAE